MNCCVPSKNMQRSKFSVGDKKKYSKKMYNLTMFYLRISTRKDFYEDYVRRKKD